MDLQPNKIDGIVKPITNTRISASEWNQLVGSCMAFITAAGFTPDADDNQQFLNAFIQIAQDLGAIGANVDLSNLSDTGENHFVQLQSGVTQSDVDYVIERYQSGTSWYRVWKSGWCEQGGDLVLDNSSYTFLKQYDSMPRVMIQVYTNNIAAATNSGAAQLTAIPSNSGFTTVGTSPSYWEGGWWFAYGYIS